MNYGNGIAEIGGARREKKWNCGNGIATIQAKILILILIKIIIHTINFFYTIININYNMTTYILNNSNSINKNNHTQ